MMRTAVSVAPVDVLYMPVVKLNCDSQESTVVNAYLPLGFAPAAACTDVAAPSASKVAAVNAIAVFMMQSPVQSSAHGEVLPLAHRAQKQYPLAAALRSDRAPQKAR